MLIPLQAFLKSLLNKLERASVEALHDFRLKRERGRLVREAAATGSLKIGAAIIAFGSSLLWARLLGPHDYGQYAYVVAWVSILSIPAGLGLPQYLVMAGVERPSAAYGLCRWADRRVAVSGTVVALLLGSAWLLPQAASAKTLFLLASPLPLLAGLSGVRQGLLQAHGWISRSQWPQLILSPILVLALLGIAMAASGRVSTADLMAATVAASVVVWITSSYQFRKSLEAPPKEPSGSAQLRSSLPFMWLNGLYLVNSRCDLIMLGSLKGGYEAGIYAVVIRAAEFVLFFLPIANLTIAPKISKLYRDGNHHDLQLLVSAVSRRLFFITAILGLILLASADWILRALYGAPYGSGAESLQILIVSQIIVAIAGPVGVLLNMTDHAKVSSTVFGVSVLLNLLLNYLLIPKFGLLGSAISTSVSSILCAGARAILAFRILGVKSSGF